MRIKTCWLKVSAEILPEKGYYNTTLACEAKNAVESKNRSIRLNNPLTKQGQVNSYEFYFKAPADHSAQIIEVRIQPASGFSGMVKSLRVNSYEAP